MGGIEYRTTSTVSLSLESIYHPEGRVFNTNTGTTGADALRYEYSIKDHLGNTRLTFTDKNNNGRVDVSTTPANEVLSESHYYPFGLAMNGPWMDDAAARDNQYKYNGKELNTDFGLGWYDYGARWYDAALGRFMAQDRYAEKYFPLSPYQYAANNPISNIDVNGDSIWVTVTSAITGTTSVQNDRYYYGQDACGNYGFLDGSGTIYSGTDAFVGQLTSALEDLRSQPVGQGLVDNLMNSTNNTDIVQTRGGNGADQESGSFIRWNPTGTNGAPDNAGGNTRPSYIGLAHEMAHVQDNWNGTMNTGTWVTYLTPSGGTGTISNAEIYATHMENRIRSEHTLPLRVSYAMDANGNPDPDTRIIRAGTSQSIYYDNTGTTLYLPLGTGATPYTY